jgi:hypothetical protein
MCLGCSVPVVPVLPLTGGGRPGRQDHFRHKSANPACEAAHGIGAMVWNVTLHLVEGLNDLSERGVGPAVLARCDPSGGPFQADLPLFRSHCPKSRILNLPRWDRVALAPSRRGARAPEILCFMGVRRVLTLAVVPADPVAALRPLAVGEPRVEIHVDADTFARLLAWNPRVSAEVPCSRATPDLTWRCPEHRGAP